VMTRAESLAPNGRQKTETRPSVRRFRIEAAHDQAQHRRYGVLVPQTGREHGHVRGLLPPMRAPERGQGPPG